MARRTTKSEEQQLEELEELRCAVESLISQIPEDPDALFDFHVSSPCPDCEFAALVEKVNNLLRSARRAVAETRRKSHFLSRAIEDLNGEVAVRKRAEEKLTELNLKTQAVVDSAGEGILTFDREGRVLESNAAAHAAFRRSEQEMAGLTFRDLFASAEGFEAPDGGDWTQVLDPSGEAECIRSDGTVFPAVISLGKFELGGEVTHTVVIRDVTEYREIQSRLCQSLKLESIGQLAAGMAHEINTPTQFVSDNVQFLQESFGDILRVLDPLLQGTEDSAERTVERMRAIAEEADLEFLLEEIPAALSQSVGGIAAIADIVRAMKEFSHPGSSDKSRVDLGRAIGNTVTVARNEWKYVAEVEVDLPEDLPEVMCYEGEINQVLLNLIVNAAHALEESSHSREDKGRIEIRAAHAGDWVELRVADNAGGIPSHLQDRIFDPFFTTKQVGKGTGQGLAIARSVVVGKHGGELLLEESSDAGTTFLIRLPIGED